MSCEFYWISGSPFAWRVHLTLEYKGIRYHSHLLNASENEHGAREFLELNPRGRVPVLRDGETVVYESVAILAYLEMRQLEPRLFGSNLAEAGHVWQRVQEIENYARNPFLRVAIAILSGGVEEERDEIHELLALCREQLDWIENVLTESRWIAGEAISAADLVFYPVLRIFLRATGKPAAKSLGLDGISFTRQWPVMANWVSQIEKLPGYLNTYPPHW